MLEQERIDRAKELLATALHASMATVNADGSPHNTPYYLMFDDSLEHFYWGSHPASLHSQNIERTGQAFVAIYDAFKRGGLFVQLKNAHATEGEELKTALKVHNKMRARENKDPIELEYYLKGPQKMYAANAVQFWVNTSIRDESDMIIQDIRVEVNRNDLL